LLRRRAGGARRAAGAAAGHGVPMRGVVGAARDPGRRDALVLRARSLARQTGRGARGRCRERREPGGAVRALSPRDRRERRAVGLRGGAREEAVAAPPRGRRVQADRGSGGAGAVVGRGPAAAWLHAARPPCGGASASPPLLPRAGARRVTWSESQLLLHERL